ncbi:hypothetical protein LEP1GSC194_1958 [Leptospira alstonii serovar Sichuan str. 79601]|uniref:Uncharacterized protein n=1 Tax=Leptospira alstonii serovar Sichuan str. 79601 TaxID=1218565 RepID=M6D0T2_9LEPT|nr:hypothetical protein LEP1GSC194_1958 [Leptospira alstonii serovar Sichuan str. 79601]
MISSTSLGIVKSIFFPLAESLAHGIFFLTALPKTYIHKSEEFDG